MKEGAADDEPKKYQPHELSADESKKYPADKAYATQVSTVNSLDKETGKDLLGDEEVKKYREMVRKHDITQAKDRARLVKAFVELVGEGRARKVELRFYDAEGKARYVWPRPSFGQEKKEETWRSDLSEFTKSMVEVAKKAKLPTEQELLKSVLRDKNVYNNKDQQAIWVLDRSGLAEEVQAELTRQFTGKVRWTGEVESVEPDAKTKSVEVAVRLPVPKDLPKGLGFGKTVSLTFPDTAKLPKKGDTFSFTGELKKAKADQDFPPVYVLYGVGPNAGQMRFGIMLAAVEPAEER